jgi:hypothetical protein
MTRRSPAAGSAPQSRAAWMPATRKPLSRTAVDCTAYRCKKVDSPPMPRSTRNPATVSAPSPMSAPEASRCGLAALQGTDEQPEQGHEDRHADEHDQTQRPRGTQQDDRHDGIRDDRPREAGRDVEEPTQAHRVRRDGRDDIAGGDRASERRAGVGGLPADELHAPEGGLHPVEHGHSMPQRARTCRHQRQPGEHQTPPGQRRRIARDNALVDGPRDRRGDEGLRHHPQHPEGNAPHQGDPLAASHPAQECPAGERSTGVPGWS